MKVGQLRTAGRNNITATHMGQVQRCCEEKTNKNATPTKQISFCGLNVSKGITKLGTKLGNSSKFHKLTEMAEGFGPVVEAAIVVGVTCILRPLAIMAMPATEGKDKETIAVKSIAGGLVGLAFTLTLFPLCLATKRVFGNPSKYIPNMKIVEKLQQKIRPEDIKSPTYQDAMRGLYNKGPDILLAKVKSGATIGVMPFLIATLFPSKSKGDKK